MRLKRYHFIAAGMLLAVIGCADPSSLSNAAITGDSNAVSQRQPSAAPKQPTGTGDGSRSAALIAPADANPRLQWQSFRPRGGSFLLRPLSDGHIYIKSAEIVGGELCLLTSDGRVSKTDRDGYPLKGDDPGGYLSYLLFDVGDIAKDTDGSLWAVAKDRLTIRKLPPGLPKEGAPSLLGGDSFTETVNKSLTTNPNWRDYKGEPYSPLKAGISAMVAQSGGKMLVAGKFDQGGYRSTLVRFNPDGSLDPTFWFNRVPQILPRPTGWVTIEIRGIRIDSQERIYLYGDGLVLRLAADGSEDRGFEPVVEPSLIDIAPDKQDRLIVTRKVGQGFEISRRLDDGKADSSFKPLTFAQAIRGVYSTLDGSLAAVLDDGSLASIDRRGTLVRTTSALSQRTVRDADTNSFAAEDTIYIFAQGNFIRYSFDGEFADVFDASRLANERDGKNYLSAIPPVKLDDGAGYSIGRFNQFTSNRGFLSQALMRRKGDSLEILAPPGFVSHPTKEGMGGSGIAGLFKDSRGGLYVYGSFTNYLGKKTPGIFRLDAHGEFDEGFAPPIYGSIADNPQYLPKKRGSLYNQITVNVKGMDEQGRVYVASDDFTDGSPLHRLLPDTRDDRQFHASPNPLPYSETYLEYDIILMDPKTLLFYQDYSHAAFALSEAGAMLWSSYNEWIFPPTWDRNFDAFECVDGGIGMKLLEHESVFGPYHRVCVSRAGIRVMEGLNNEGIQP